MDDIRAVLVFANVELLEMRILDEQLDRALDEGYEALSRKPHFLSLPGSHDKDLTHIAQLQVDGALIFERVTNTLKLLGDQYLARVYRLVSQRFHRGMGCQHPSEIADTGEHLRQDVGSSWHQTDGGARVDHHGTHHTIDRCVVVSDSHPLRRTEVVSNFMSPNSEWRHVDCLRAIAQAFLRIAR